jgi:hypothetical protein
MMDANTIVALLPEICLVTTTLGVVLGLALRWVVDWIHGPQETMTVSEVYVLFARLERKLDRVLKEKGDE